MNRPRRCCRFRSLAAASRLMGAASRLAGFCLLFFCAACSFNYDLPPENPELEPDVVMKNVEYVRVRGGSPSVRMLSAEVRRFEPVHIMELDALIFEQYNASVSPELLPDVNILGNAGAARIQTDTGNLTMDGGVSIKINSEDLSINTQSIEWKDKERLLSAPGRIEISRGDGTKLSGESFSADARRRSWEFLGNVEGEIPEAAETESVPEETVENAAEAAE